MRRREKTGLLGLSPGLVAVVVVVVLVAGAVNGLAGFGFALVGTMALATVIDPASAVVFIILPGIRPGHAYNVFSVDLLPPRQLLKQRI